MGIDSKKFEITYHLGDDRALGLPEIDFSKTECAMLYVGTLSWEANIDGLLWFFNACWHEIQNKAENVTLYIIGKNPDERLLQASEKFKNIVFTGFVEDLEPYFNKCKVAIAPLRFGSGTKVKVLTYMYRGIPCVTSSIGVEGLEITHGKHMFISDDANSFTKCCIELLTSENLCKTMAKESRDVALKNYSWEPVLKSHVESIQKRFHLES